MSAEHPFAQYIRILGKGPNLSRSLTEAETHAAVRMVMAGEVEPVQLGAFLCLLRVRTETAEEVAGFVRAIREFVRRPEGAAPADLDWPTYAGKARQLPWYLLAALLLAQDGVRVFMHGAEGHTAGRLYAHTALAALGVPIARSLDEAAGHLAARRFAYLGLQHLSPRLEDLMGLRGLLGVRSPIHTVARQINPFDAPYQVLSVTHPDYRQVHRDGAARLGQPHLVVFKGEGGEAERRPAKPCEVLALDDGVASEAEWPPLLPATVQAKDEDMDLARLGAVWRGDVEDDYAVATIIGTVAIALRLLGRAATPAEAQGLAERLWACRRIPAQWAG